jgi:hypothetical protein
MYLEGGHGVKFYSQLWTEIFFHSFVYFLLPKIDEKLLAGNLPGAEHN